MTDFLGGVNRVLRINGVIQGDDDALASFSDTQHKETMNLAKIAIQSTLTYLVSAKLIPYEEAEGEIVTVASTRTYTLPSDFIRFVGKNPFLLELSGSGGTSQNRVINMYPGGEDRLKREVLDYKDQSGTPNWFYFIDTTTKQIGLYQVPDAATYYGFQYEKEVFVTAEANTLPFHNTQEDYAFLDMAARYYHYLFTNEPITSIFDDPIFKVANTSLIQLMKGSYPAMKYGRSYK